MNRPYEKMRAEQGGQARQGRSPDCGSWNCDEVNEGVWDLSRSNMASNKYSPDRYDQSILLLTTALLIKALYADCLHKVTDKSRMTGAALITKKK